MSGYTLSQILPASAVGFTFNVVAAATPLTPAEYLAEQTQEAEYLRTAILADPTATQALQVLALNATSWDNLYLTALIQAGLLRPVDEPPAVHLDPDVNSMMATLAAGILAGSGGNTILTDGNLPAFFAQLQTWYGDDPTLIETGVDPNNPPVIAPTPSSSFFNLNATSPTVSEAFNVYVRQISHPDDIIDIYFPDLANPAPAQAADINQFLASAGASDQGATLIGPTAYGSNQFLPVGQNLPYTVQFQSASAATSPVEEVRIVTQLDPGLDPRTFRLGALEIGGLTVQIPGGRGTFQEDFDYTQTAGFILRVSAGMDLDTDTATWLLQAIDPTTGEVLQNATEGLLAPGASGFISYTVQPMKGLATGTQISASAQVLFNNAPPQETSTLTQAIDGTAPTTTLTATPLTAGSSNYQVTWNAQDDPTGSGIKSVTVYVSVDGGDYTIWLDQTTATSAVYQGQSGHTYVFLALASDNAGNMEQPPSGVVAPANGSGADLGAIPTVPQTSPQDVPPAPTPTPTTPPVANPLFTQAQEAIPSAQPATRRSQFTTVLQPFTAQAFATGILQSHANIGPVAIVVMPDGSVLVSGGPGRNELFHLSSAGGAVGTPLATLPDPIYDMAFDSAGNLWATTGGGPLLELNPTTGSILGQYSDSLTQSLAIDPATGHIYVSSGQGVENFNPSTHTFTHFSDLRVGSLAFAPDGSLWAALWPVDQGDVIRFDATGQAVKELEFADDVDSIAFGVAGSVLDGLLFVSHDEALSAGQGTELTMVDLATMQTLAVATGGSRGDEIKTTPDGRVLLSQSLQVDVLGPVTAPHVLAVNPPPAAVVALPLGSISVTFSQDMLADNVTDPGSVLDPNNFVLQGDSAGLVPIRSVVYDAASRTAVLGFNALSADYYNLKVLSSLLSNLGVPLAQEFDSSFTATADLSSVISLQFGATRSDRATGTVSFDVTITNTSTHNLLLPIVLHLAPQEQFAGEPQGNSGRAADGSWLIDLSGDLPPDGILGPGQRSAGQTITVTTPDDETVNYDLAVTGVAQGNQAPVFVTNPITTASAGQSYTYQAVGFDENGDRLSYLLVSGPAGMAFDSSTGLLTWMPTANSPVQAQVALQVYDSAGSSASQKFTIAVAGANQAPAFVSLSSPVSGKEGVFLTIPVQAVDPQHDPLTYWADNLPPGAVFDAAQQALDWTPAYGEAGTYQNVVFTVSDGLRQVSQDVTIVIAPNPQPPKLLEPAETTGQEGSPIQIQLRASDQSGAPLHYSSADLPAGATLDPATGLFLWTPSYAQQGTYTFPVTVSDGPASTTQTADIVVLHADAVPVFENLRNFQVLENQQIQFLVAAIDPNGVGLVTSSSGSDSLLVPTTGSVAGVTETISGLPAGATFDQNTLLFTWTPDFSQIGQFPVTFTATKVGSNGPLSTSQTVTINVLAVDRAPQLTPIVDQTVQGGATLGVPVTAVDPLGGKLTLAVSGLPAFGTFVDHGDGTGTFQFAPGLPQKGAYTITVQATDDGRGGATPPMASQESFILDVAVASEPPQLQYIGDKVARIGSPFQLTLYASDLDQQPLTFSASGLPAGATITPSNTYGQAVVSWVPTVADAGIYGVTFLVTNTGNGNPTLVASDQQTIHLVVRSDDQAPVLANPGNQSVVEGQTLIVTLQATDPDGDALTYSVSNAPLGSTFDPVHGVLTLATNPFQAGDYPNITFSASDGFLTSTQSITIHVTATDHAPTLLPVAQQSGREGALVQFTLLASDPDGGDQTYAAVTSLPAGAALDAHTGTFTWTPSFTQAGYYSFIFSATDPGGLSDSTTVSLQITNVDRPPTIQVVNQSVLVGANLAFTVIATDPDVGDTLTYSASGLPAGSVLDSRTGVVSWTPGAGQAGIYPVVFTVSDSQLAVSETAVINALLASQAPTVTLTVTPSFPAQPGQQVVVHATATGIAAIASLSLVMNGQAVSLDAQGRYFFTATAPGRVQFQATATDVGGQVGQAIAVVKVLDLADTVPPAVSLDSSLSNAILTQPKDVIGTVLDSNLDSWTLNIALLGSTTSTTLASGTAPVTNATLASLDPGTLQNGVYVLTLTATDIAGRTSQQTVTLQIDSASKSGQYLRSETDLVVPFGATTVNVTRVYDSLARNEISSFGYGWSLAVEDTSLQTSVPPTGNEASGIYNPFIQGTRVYLTLPTGQRVGFTFTPQRRDQPGVTSYTPAYVADAGVNWQLSSAAAVLIRGGAGFYDAQTGLPYNPASGLFVGSEYTLTAPDGTIYDIDAARGVQKEILPGGEQLYYSGSGITSSTGVAVQFIRDAMGRITTVEAPDGTRVVYTYDAQGNLASAHNTLTGQSSRYGYSASDPHLLTDASAPASGSGAAVTYGPTVNVVPITADLGGTTQFLAHDYNGNLAGNATGSFTFLLTAAEIASTSTGTVLVSIAVSAAPGSTVEPSVATIAGLTPLVQRTGAGTSFTLFAFDRAGLELLDFTNTGSGASGGYSLHISIAGDADGSGSVNGYDGALVAGLIGTAAGQPGYSLAADGNGDGVIDAADVQIVAANLGFQATSPPVVQPGSVMTHVNLPVEYNLGPQATDPQGDPVYFRIVGATGGVATLNPDGETATFVPTPGFTGTASFQFVADNGLAVSTPATITVNVSSARLISLDFQKREPRINQGGGIQLVAVGDFADQQDVVLDPSYVTFSSSDPAVVAISSDGRLVGNVVGTSVVIISAQGVQAATAVTVGQPQDTVSEDLYLHGLALYPLSVSLSSAGGTRQLDLHPGDDFVLATDLVPGTTGTVYILSQPGVVTVDANGLLTAVAPGSVTVTVIHGPAEALTTVQVSAPVAGPVVVDAGGAVVQGSDGSLVAVPPGDLTGGTTVSITPLTLASLPQGVPNDFVFADAFQLDVGPNEAQGPCANRRAGPRGRAGWNGRVYLPRGSKSRRGRQSSAHLVADRGRSGGRRRHGSHRLAAILRRRPIWDLHGRVQWRFRRVQRYGAAQLT